MPTIQQGNKTTYERQPTGTLKLYADGSCEATETFKGVYAKRVDNLPVALQPHPDFPSLRLYEFLGSLEPGGIYQYACVYKGILPDTDVWALMQEEVTLMSAQEPVETYWRFSYPWNDPPVTTTLLSQVQAAIDANVADITAVYPGIDPEAPTAGGKAAYNLWLLRRRGIDSVKVPQLSVRLSYVADASLGTWELNALQLIHRYVGTIALDSDGTNLAINRARSVPRPIGFDLDRLTEQRNYLFNGVTWRLQGNLLNVSEEYLLSGRSGWVPYLYDRESSA